MTVLQANRENGLKAQIFVTAKDTGAVQTYVVQFQEESPQIERLELRLPEGQELKEDQTVPLEVIAHYQDGSQASLKADQIDVKTRAGSQGKAVATNKGLELREAGLVHLEANFQGQTGRSQLYHHAKSRRKDGCQGASCTNQHRSKRFASSSRDRLG